MINLVPLRFTQGFIYKAIVYERNGMVLKQRITANQLADLTHDQQEKLRRLWKPEYGDCFYDELNGEVFYGQVVIGYDADHYEPNMGSLPLLSIGQCIELLQNEAIWEEDEWYPILVTKTKPSICINWSKPEDYPELIGALWEAVKEVLAPKVR